MENTSALQRSTTEQSDRSTRLKNWTLKLSESEVGDDYLCETKKEDV